MGDPDGFAWWQRGVVYQIYPRSFQDGDGDGVGDLRGIRERLDHLAWLGVDALWLSPIFASPMEDGGYDVTDHTGVDPLFGTIDDFDAMVAAAHRLGLRVILDFVPNHTSHRHSWFVEARRHRASPRRDWYLWRDPAHGGGPPNNWRSATDHARPGSAWSFDQRTGQWYLATFSPLQPDLNWANPRVREAMCDVLRYWLDRGVDGFRIDMVGFLGKDPQWRDEPPPDDPGRFDYYRDARYHLNRPETLDHLREMRAVVDRYPDRVLIGEMIYGAPVDQMVRFATAGGIDLPTNFSLITLPFAAGPVQRHLDEYDAATRAAGTWPNWCIGNHDQPRVGALGAARSRQALLLLLTARGTPFLYYGDEIGMTNVTVPPDRRQDPFSVPQHDVPRDAVRTPMQWDAGPNAGFCPADVRPWLPVGDHAHVNVTVERDDDASVLTFVRRLLALRRRIAALSVGSYHRLDPVPSGCVAFERRRGAERAVVALNLGETTAWFARPDLADGEVLLTTQGPPGTTGDGMTLRPGDGVVVAPR